ncbi:hypothetical protein [Ideonella dechloratans]|uniref:hypothetical protein n=2 Tax=Ideonella dechloratans TaxID=36863 RepID=UPI0035B3A6C1
MKALIALLYMGLAGTAGATELDRSFSSHDAFYAQVARDQHLTSAFRRRALPDAPPDTPQLSVVGLAKAWGRVQLASDAIVINGRRLRWSESTQPFGRQGPIQLHLELAQLWEGPQEPNGAGTLCLQSPMGSSGSAARWQHVVLVRRSNALVRPSIQAWTAPYASCQAVWRDAHDELVAGVFEFNFESEQAVRTAHFVVHALREHSEVARYVLSLPNPANLFSFKAVPATPQ